MVSSPWNQRLQLNLHIPDTSHRQSCLGVEFNLLRNVCSGMRQSFSNFTACEHSKWSNAYLQSPIESCVIVTLNQRRLFSPLFDPVNNQGRLRGWKPLGFAHATWWWCVSVDDLGVSLSHSFSWRPSNQPSVSWDKLVSTLWAAAQAIAE